VPEIGSLEIARCRDALDLGREDPVGKDPADAREQRVAVVLDALAQQRRTELGLEQVR